MLLSFPVEGSKDESGCADLAAVPDSAADHGVAHAAIVGNLRSKYLGMS